MTDDSIDSLNHKIRRLEESLEQERKKNELLLESMVDGVYTTDLNKCITHWNQGAERITGFRSEDVLGRSCKQLLSHTDYSGTCLCDVSCPLTAAMSKDSSMLGKNVYTNTASGDILPVSVSCSPLKDEHGNMVGAIEVFRDISEQKRLEEQKSRFFSMVTHDLKSPLTTIIGYTDLITENICKYEPDAIKEFLAAIKQSSVKMSGMITDFLNLTRLDAPKLFIHKEQFVIYDLLDRLRTAFRPVAENKGITLSINAEESLPMVVMDPDMLERAVSNLIDNALKYTPDGGSVDVSVRRSSGPGHYLDVEVSDNGLGIPRQELDKVFDMYFRTSETTNIEGSGLGLALVKAVAEGHGGSVGASSELGKGSTFSMRLPCCDTPQPGASGGA